VKQKRGRWVVKYDSVANVANEVTERQSVILELMVAGEQYATQTLSQMTGIGLRTLQRELAVLEKVGRVRRVGMTKNLKWVRI